MATVTRTVDAIHRDLQRERVILGHALHRYDLDGIADTWRRIDQLLDERLVAVPNPRQASEP